MRKTLLIIALAAGARILISHYTDHPGIFTPIIGMSIFAGCYLKKWWGSLISLGAMLASDYVIGLYEWKLLAVVYLGVLIAYALGMLLAKHLKWYNVIGTSFASSLIYFLITNYAVWRFMDWYPHTVAGLQQCFLMAIPYFQRSLASDLGWTVGFFGVYALMKATEEVFSRKPICVL